MSKKKYIHPEKVFGIGTSNLDKVINGLAFEGRLNSEGQEKILNRLSKKEKLKLKEIVNNDRTPDGKFWPSVSYQMRFFHDMVESKPANKIDVYAVSKSFFGAVKGMRRKIPTANIPKDDDFIYLLLKDEIYEGAYINTFSWRDA